MRENIVKLLKMTGKNRNSVFYGEIFFKDDRILLKQRLLTQKHGRWKGEMEALLQRIISSQLYAQRK